MTHPSLSMPGSPEHATNESRLEMVDLRGQYASIKGEIDEAIEAVLEAGSFIKGPFVSRFENALAAWIGTPHVVGVGNGTDALQIAYMAAGIGPGDEVITSAFSFIATAEAAVVLGARPVFVDIDPETFNLDPDQVKDRITDRTRAIVPVHLFGQAAEMDPLLDLARTHDLVVIEDAAQAIGAQLGDRQAGTFGHLGCFSFFPSKNLGAYGDGGAVTTADEVLHDRVRMIANHGARKKYYNEVPGLNSRLDALQAAILHVKLRHLDTFTQSRIAAADRYDALLGNLDEVLLPVRAPDRFHVFHQYTIRIRGKRPDSRDRVAATLKELGIPFAIYYPVCLHHLPVMRIAAGEPDRLPHAEAAAGEVLSLPMHTELTPSHQERVAAGLREALTRLQTGRG